MNVLVELLGFRFHHQHRVGGAGDHQVELGFDHLVERGVEDIFSLMKPTGRRRSGP